MKPTMATYFVPTYSCGKSRTCVFNNNTFFVGVHNFTLNEKLLFEECYLAKYGDKLQKESTMAFNQR